MRTEYILKRSQTPSVHFSKLHLEMREKKKKKREYQERKSISPSISIANSDKQSNFVNQYLKNLMDTSCEQDQFNFYLNDTRMHIDNKDSLFAWWYKDINTHSELQQMAI